MFEIQQGGADYVDELIKRARITVDYRPSGFLDGLDERARADGYYSTRSASASACVAHVAHDKWPA
jgi:hypothetical protein